MAEFAKQVDGLTTEHLSKIVKNLAKAPFPVDNNFLTYGLATEVLRFFFGNAWTNENVFPMHEDVSLSNKSGRVFLKTESSEREDQFRHMQRVVSLAEQAFNLQGIEGIKQRISLLNKLDLEAALGELECTALLAKKNFNFRFVSPMGEKGKDYEGEITTSTGRTVNCEMKSRSEQTTPSSQSLWRTLDQARKQLPKDKPAIILVKIPESWVIEKNIKAIIEEATEKVYRQSHRIVGIVFTWETWHSTPEDYKVMIRRFNPIPNKRSALYEDDIDNILSGIGRANNPDWVRFQELVKKVHTAA